MLDSLLKLITPKESVYAHCDLPCGVYDPAQAKIEAQSVKACMEKYASSSDADFKSRAVAIKEERSGFYGQITSSQIILRHIHSFILYLMRQPNLLVLAAVRARMMLRLQIN
jgi:hypothetical protein